jgi:hypothetical protein
MKTAPTAAIVVLLGISSLYLKMVTEDQAGIYRLSCNVQLKLRSIWYGHMRKVLVLFKEPILQIETDK